MGLTSGPRIFEITTNTKPPHTVPVQKALRASSPKRETGGEGRPAELVFLYRSRILPFFLIHSTSDLGTSPR